MVCKCCGRVISEDRIYCIFCENNEEYQLKVAKASKAKFLKRKTIKKNTSNEMNENDSKIVNICFYINSGVYLAKFDKENYNEKTYLEEYESIKKSIKNSNLVCFFSIVSIIIFVWLRVISKVGFFSILVFIAIIVCIVTRIANMVSDTEKRKLIYEYILYDLTKKGKRITHQNKTTGTISYIENGKTKQVSVYRGYNSHANSKYWN